MGIVAFEADLAPGPLLWRAWYEPPRIEQIEVSTYSFLVPRVEPWPEMCGYCGRKTTGLS